MITNADSVKMYKNDVFIKEYHSEDSPYKHLKHGPIKIDDYIGSTLEEGEKMPHGQAEAVKALLNEVAKVGLYGLSKLMYAKAGRLIVQYHMSMEDAVELYNKYIGDWGGASTSYRFEAIRDGKVVKTITKTPMTKRTLSTDVSSNELFDGRTYDVAAIRIKAVDENGNILPFANDPVIFETSGNIELIGPKVVSLQGGMFGTYVRTTGKAGRGSLKITDVNGEITEIGFEIREGSR
jgi:beta-galactosidase